MVGLSVALTALTAYSTRLTLGEQIAHLQGATATPWRLELQGIDGGLTHSRLRLHLGGPAALDLDLRLQHRLLTSRMTGEIRRPGDVATVPMATLSGRIDYHPWSGVTPWTLALRGAGGTTPPGPLASWRVAPWSADLSGADRRIHAHIQLPRLDHGDSGSGGSDLRGARLLLELDAPEGDPIHGHLRLQLALAEGHGPLPSGPLSSGPATLDLEIGRTPTDWSFDMRFKVADLYHQGIPVLRIPSLRQHAQGTVIPMEGKGGLWWNGRLDLDAESDYGPLRTVAIVRGPTGTPDPLRTGRLRLHATLPVGLWGLLQHLQPDWTGELERSGITQTQGETLTLNALLRDGAWYAPATGGASEDLGPGPQD